MQLAGDTLFERQDGDERKGKKEDAQDNRPIKKSLLHTPPGAEYAAGIAAAQSSQSGFLALQDDCGNQKGAQDDLGNTEICLHETSNRFNEPQNGAIISETHFPPSRW
jgi:hypothetical protein